MEVEIFEYDNHDGTEKLQQFIKELDVEMQPDSITVLYSKRDTLAIRFGTPPCVRIICLTVEFMYAAPRHEGYSSEEISLDGLKRLVQESALRRGKIYLSGRNARLIEIEHKIQNWRYALFVSSVKYVSFQ